MPLPSYSRGGGSGNPGSAPCRVTTDKSALQTTSHGGHDSFLLGRGSGRYQRVNGTYCGPETRSKEKGAWQYSGDVDEATCMLQCQKVACSCFDILAKN